MLVVKFVPTESDHEANAGGLTGGQVVVSGEAGECSSSETVEQPLLLQQVCELLGGLLHFMTHKTEKQFVFISLYGDYGFRVVRAKSEIRIYCRNGKVPIATTDGSGLRQVVWNAAFSLHRWCAANVNFSLDGMDGTKAAELDIVGTLEAVMHEWLSAFPGEIETTQPTFTASQFGKRKPSDFR